MVITQLAANEVKIDASAKVLRKFDKIEPYWWKLLTKELAGGSRKRLPV